MNKQETTAQEAIDIINDVTWQDNGRHYGKIEAVRNLAISALTQQLNNGWIPCKFRQPSDEESIKYKGEFTIQNAKHILPYTATWNRSEKLWQDDEGYQIDYVTAWQPLPEPYKEGE